jgi:biopolymer transport protein ExbD
MRISKKKGVSVSVDLTPMIDVVFQLILFFLVSTTFAVLPGISLSLPQSSTAQNTDVAGITITVESSGTVWFNKEPVTYESLAKNLAVFDTGAVKKDTYPVTLEAADTVTNGTIVHIFDILRENGFSAVNLRTTDHE